MLETEVVSCLFLVEIIGQSEYFLLSEALEHIAIQILGGLVNFLRPSFRSKKGCQVSRKRTNQL